MNEPVAWMETYKGEPNNLDWDKNNLYCEGEFHNVVPLYTHPVKELKNIVLASATCSCGKVMEVTNLQPVKELTDEEIIKVNEDIGTCWDVPHRFAIQIARAILRKAQEK